MTKMNKKKYIKDQIEYQVKHKGSKLYLSLISIKIFILHK